MGSLKTSKQTNRKQVFKPMLGRAKLCPILCQHSLPLLLPSLMIPVGFIEGNNTFRLGHCWQLWVFPVILAFPALFGSHASCVFAMESTQSYNDLRLPLPYRCLSNNFPRAESLQSSFSTMSGSLLAKASRSTPR